MKRGLQYRQQFNPFNFTSSQNREWKYFFQKIAYKEISLPKGHSILESARIYSLHSKFLNPPYKIDILKILLNLTAVEEGIQFKNLNCRLLPDLDEEKLENKIQRRKDIKLFQQKIAGIHLEFVRPPKFSNPSLLKDPIDDKLIIEEVQQRFKLQVTKNHLLSMVNKITTYGQFTLQIENFYSPELQDYTTFQITVVTKKPIMKVQKLIDEVATKDDQNKDENKDKSDQKVVKQGKEKEKEKEAQK